MSSLDVRAIPGLVGGLAGCALAVGGAMSASPVLSIGGAVCALVAGASSLTLLEQLHRTEEQASSSAGEVDALRFLEVTAHRDPGGLVDLETGFPDGRFFELVLETRIAAARRHLWPITVVLVEVTQPQDGSAGDALLSFTDLLRFTLREADVICRTGPRSFALILEDTNESGGVWAAERLQVAVAKQSVAVRTVAAGVASYPTHGLRGDEVLNRARHALARAAAADPGMGVGVVEVATGDHS